MMVEIKKVHRKMGTKNKRRNLEDIKTFDTGFVVK